MKVIFGRYVKAIGAVLLAGIIFPSGVVLADTSSIDDLNITVPASCSISGVGQNSHNATILGGTYNSNIGETTMKVTCNDYNGFSIYAIGYTDDRDGKNVLVGEGLSSAFNIPTGTLISGANSQWAMKLSVPTNPAPAYPVSIQNDFDDYHTVPDSYTLVAKRDFGTDLGEVAEGSSFKSTYQAYISQAQPAGTYKGKVKYTLVHPHTEAVFPDQLAGLTLRFDDNVDVPSLLPIVGGNWTYNDLKFVMKVTPQDILDYSGVSDPSIKTWSQLVEAAPVFLEYMGATNIQSDMRILDEEQDHAYISYDGFYPWCNDYSYDIQLCSSGHNLYYHVDNGVEWQFLPPSTGSVSYDFLGETVVYNSFRDVMEGMFSGAHWTEQYYDDNWYEDYFRTISIYSGNDINDTALAGWIKNNSVTLRILEPASVKKWTFNEYAPSDNEMRWNITGDVLEDGGGKYGFDYIATDNSYGPTIWSFYYNNIDSPHVPGDGFIYLTEDLSIPAYNINFEAGWYYGNNQDPTSYVKVSPPSIEIRGGEDLYNPALRDWLESNATYVELSQS